MTIQDIQHYPLSGLKFKITNYIRGFDDECIDQIDCISDGFISFKISADWYFNVCHREIKCTPILYPLSCLTEEIEVYGEKFVPIVELLKLKYPDQPKEKIDSKVIIHFKVFPIMAGFSFFSSSGYITIQENYKEYPYWIIQKLQSWFINYAGIEAVNPFDLQENPYKSNE